MTKTYYPDVDQAHEMEPERDAEVGGRFRERIAKRPRHAPDFGAATGGNQDVNDNVFGKPIRNKIFNVITTLKHKL